MEKELRRHRNALIILGSGTIAFGFWSLIKTVLLATLAHDRLAAMLRVDAPEQSDWMILYFVLFGLLIIELSLRLVVGLSARAEGYGKKKSVAYLIACGFIIAVSAFSLFESTVGFSLDDYDSVLDAAVSFGVEITSLVTLVQLERSAIKVRKLTRALGEEG